VEVLQIPLLMTCIQTRGAAALRICLGSLLSFARRILFSVTVMQGLAYITVEILLKAKYVYKTDPNASGNTTCGGLVEDTYIVLHDTAEECCSSEYGWMGTELCAARSDQINVNKYWPDKIKSKCILDSQEPAEDLSISIFDSVFECCKEGIHWLSEAACLTASGYSVAIVASNLFFVDWVHGQCVQDCDGEAPCAGLDQARIHDEMYVTAGQCCDKIPWVLREDCVFGGYDVGS